MGIIQNSINSSVKSIGTTASISGAINNVKLSNVNQDIARMQNVIKIAKMKQEAKKLQIRGLRKKLGAIKV